MLKHAGWLNQAEIEISLCCRQGLGKCRIPALKDLQYEARLWTRKMNQNHTWIS